MNIQIVEDNENKMQNRRYIRKAEETQNIIAIFQRRSYVGLVRKEDFFKCSPVCRAMNRN